MGLAICSVNGYTLPTSGVTGYNAISGETITIALTAPGSQWQINCTNADGYNVLSTVALVQATKVQNFSNDTCVFVVPLGGFSALQFTSTYNNDPNSTFTFGVFVKVNGLRGFFPDEILESDITSGVSYDLNAMLVNIGTGGGGGFSANGDLSGTSTDQTVVGLQNNPISSVAPTTGQVLTWNGTYWIAENAGTGFTAGGDLTGTSTSQQVVSLTGAAGRLNIAATGNIITWAAATTAPGIQQTIATSGAGQAMSFYAQSAAVGSNAKGGTINITGGAGDGTGVGGNCLVQTGDGYSSITGTSLGGNGFFYLHAAGTGGQVLTRSNTFIIEDVVNGIVVDFTNSHLGASSMNVGSAVTSYTIGQSSTAGATGAPFTLQAQQAITTGGLLTLSSGSAATAGNVLLQTGGTTQITVSPTEVTLASLAGFGDGYVAVDNTGNLSWSAGSGSGGGSPTGSAGGDLSGTYPDPNVIGIQGVIVSSTVPTAGQVLTATGSTSAVWENPSGSSVTWANDLLGSTDTNQYVVSLTGAGGTVNIFAADLTWASTVISPKLAQTAVSGGTAQNMLIQAQSSIGGTSGNLLLSAGAPVSGTPGQVILQGGSGINLLSVGQYGVQPGAVSVTVAGSNITLNSAQYKYGKINLTGTLTAPIELIFPSGAAVDGAQWIVDASGLSGFGDNTITLYANGNASLGMLGDSGYLMAWVTYSNPSGKLFGVGLNV